MIRYFLFALHINFNAKLAKVAQSSLRFFYLKNSVYEVWIPKRSTFTVHVISALSLGPIFSPVSMQRFIKVLHLSQ